MLWKFISNKFWELFNKLALYKNYYKNIYIDH